MDDTHAYILMDCEGGNPVSAPVSDKNKNVDINKSEE